MRTVPAILYMAWIVALAGCQGLHAVSTVMTSSSACSRSERKTIFPTEGELKVFDLSFRLATPQSLYEHSDRVTCRYEGSICGDGKWFQIWREDKMDGFEQQLEGGDIIMYHYHSFCANIFHPGSDLEQKFVLKRAGRHPRLISIDELREIDILVDAFTIEPSANAF